MHFLPTFPRVLYVLHGHRRGTLSVCMYYTGTEETHSVGRLKEWKKKKERMKWYCRLKKQWMKKKWKKKNSRGFQMITTSGACAWGWSSWKKNNDGRQLLSWSYVKRTDLSEVERFLAVDRASWVCSSLRAPRGSIVLSYRPTAASTIYLRVNFYQWQLMTQTAIGEGGWRKKVDVVVDVDRRRLLGLLPQSFDGGGADEPAAGFESAESHPHVMT